MNTGSFTLYGYWRSSASWRVRIGLHLKGIPFRYEAVHLVQDGGQQHGDAHAARNPMRQVPVLAFPAGDGTEVHLTQSLAILAWLDATQDGPKLWPSDALMAARAMALTC